MHFCEYDYLGEGLGEHGLASASQLIGQVTLFKSVNLSVLSFII